MSGFWLSDEQEAIVESVTRLCAGFDADYWRRTDETGEFPEAFVEAMAVAVVTEVEPEHREAGTQQARRSQPHVIGIDTAFPAVQQQHQRMRHAVGRRAVHTLQANAVTDLQHHRRVPCAFGVQAQARAARAQRTGRQDRLQVRAA